MQKKESQRGRYDLNKLVKQYAMIEPADSLCKKKKATLFNKFLKEDFGIFYGKKTLINEVSLQKKM
jgi:hypothetical protein